MSAPAPPPPPNPKTIPTPENGMDYVIPKSWLKRPKLPSRNMMIFISVVSSLTGLYIYDRRECKTIKQSYIDRVKHLAEEPMKPFELPRRLTVYACKWPGDDEHDRSMRYFKKYVKPVLAAAAVDYEIHNGNFHGALANLVAEKVKQRRREELGLSSPPPPPVPMGAGPPPSFKQDSPTQRELKGGIVIIGRHTFKEYMHGLKRGWSESLEKVETDELLAQELEKDGRFDEPLDPNASDDLSPPSSEPSEPSTQPTQIIFSPFQQLKPQPPSSQSQKPAEKSGPKDERLNAPPPTRLPEQPPLLLVPYTSILGFLNVPLMIAEYFNERQHVKNGCEAAYKIIKGQARQFDAPPLEELSTKTDVYSGSETPSDDASTPNADLSPPQVGDLAFDLTAERHYRSSYNDTPKEVEKARESYYSSLSTKLAAARDYMRNTNLGEEKPKEPPATEVELRAERFKKEKKWREQLEGFKIAKAGSAVAWDERFRDALRVYTDPPSDEADI